MYLALTAVQAISGGGIAGLRRRHGALRRAVNKAKMTNEYTEIARIDGSISIVEIGVQAFSRSLLVMTTTLFIIAMAYFIFCTIYQTADAHRDGLIFIIGFYAVLPVAIFLVSTALIAKRWKQVSGPLANAERRFRSSFRP
ncbi:hypothetical protein [Sphingomonas insulae]|uniref:hypothetical protein n=2 Tax=Sphingomonas insulae TaxID=424800 RepID=UPI0013D8CFB4|nr:hypothetical protein [Sphingomonas insulae]